MFTSNVISVLRIVLLLIVAVGTTFVSVVWVVLASSLATTIPAPSSKS